MAFKMAVSAFSFNLHFNLSPPPPLSRSNGLSDNSTENQSSESTYQKITIYGSITGAVIIFNVARVIMVSCVAINASRVYHNRALRSLLRAPIHFFDTNTLGTWPCSMLSCSMMSCMTMSCRTMSCMTMSCRMMSCRTMSCMTMSCMQDDVMHDNVMDKDVMHDDVIQDDVMQDVM